MSAFTRLYHGETRVDFIGKRKLWFLISGAILAISIGSFILQGFNFGIEFEGGVAIQAPVDESGPAGDLSDVDLIAHVRDALQDVGVTTAQVQVASEGDQRIVIVQTQEIPDAEAQQEVKAAVRDAVGASETDTTFQSIGRKWGAEITSKAIRALIIFLIVILAFISWRFEWKMGVSAIVALVHDLAITAGIYSLVGFEVTPSTVIAILTILGYSLYDTVVVFDKVEEETNLHAATGRMTYQQSANIAMNQVFARSLNTSLATLIPVAALLIVGTRLTGAETLKDLALALFVGILAGTYSSMFIATPILSIMKESEPRYRSVREKVLRDAKRAAGVRSPEPVAASASAGEPVAPVSAAASRPTPNAPGPRPRAGSKKAKRRKKR